MDNFTISIIIATYNRAHLIEEAMLSIINQTYQNWECLVIDDGSEDLTKELVSQYEIKDSRFKYHLRKPEYQKGIPGCRNMGLDLARGEYVIFFDDDDIVHPQNLKICSNQIQQEDTSFCRYEVRPFWKMLDEEKSGYVKSIRGIEKRRVDRDTIPEIITGKLAFGSCSVLWSRKCFERIRFNESLMYAEEWECYSRILSEDYTGVSIDTVLYFNRKHPNSNTGEFQNNNKIRKASKEKAALLIIDNLGSKELLDDELERFFIWLGFNLKSEKIILHTLAKRGYGNVTMAKYRLAFWLYPILRPFLKLKGALKSA